jgi:hypothetical protein
MEASCRRVSISLALLAALAVATGGPAGALADELAVGEHARRWWGTLGGGIGEVHRDVRGRSSTSDLPYLSFEFGWVANPRLLLGIELSGHLIEAGDLQDPSEGSGLSQAFVEVRAYPLASAPFHVQLGAGWTSLWDNGPGALNEDAAGWEIGVGYDWPIGQRTALTPFLRYGRADFGVTRVSAITIGAGLTWR